MKITLAAVAITLAWSAMLTNSPKLATIAAAVGAAVITV